MSRAGWSVSKTSDLLSISRKASGNVKEPNGAIVN